MKRNTLISSLLIILFSTILIFTGACGPSNPESTTVTGKPSGEQTITLNLAGENNTIDPNRASWMNERAIIVQIFDGLMTFDRNLALAPMVAKQLPTLENKGISTDGKTYTIKLRNDVTWSDGKKVTANDFEYSLKRLFDPDLAAEYASFYFNIVGGESYYGATDKTAEEKTALKDAVGVKAIDDYTLEIKLTDALPTFTVTSAMAFLPYSKRYR